MAATSEPQGGSSDAAVHTKHGRDEGDQHLQDYKKVKLDKEGGGDMIEEREEASVINTDSDLSLAVELDSDESNGLTSEQERA
jgi:hypothetical protein